MNNSDIQPLSEEESDRVHGLLKELMSDNDALTLLLILNNHYPEEVSLKNLSDSYGMIPKNIRTFSKLLYKYKLADNLPTSIRATQRGVDFVSWMRHTVINSNRNQGVG